MSQFEYIQQSCSKDKQHTKQNEQVHHTNKRINNIYDEDHEIEFELD